MFISSSEALNQIMQHVGRTLNKEYEQVQVYAPEPNDEDTQKNEHLKSFEWAFWQTKDPAMVFPQIHDPNFTDNNLNEAAKAFVGNGAAHLSKSRIKFDDIWEYVQELFGSGAVTGRIGGKPVDRVSLASHSNYHALLRGDEVTMPVLSKSIEYMRETEKPLTGPLMIDEDELATALANNRPEMDKPRINLGGRKPTMQIAVALGAWVLWQDHTISWDELQDRVSAFYDEKGDDKSDNTLYRGTVLKPLFEIFEADRKAGKDNDTCVKDVIAIAQRYTNAEAAKNDTRGIVKDGAARPARKPR